MKKPVRLIGGLSLILIFLTAWGAGAKESYPHKTQIAKHPAPALEIVEAREMKFLIDPAKVGYTPEKGLTAIWERVKRFAKKENIALKEKDFNADGLTYSTKVYYDTPEGDLTRLGYVVRITTKYFTGKPVSAALTVKFIDRDTPERVFTSMPEEEDAAIEENVGPAPAYTLDTYLEKSVKVDVELSGIPVTLADFAELVPHLGTLGLDPGVRLTGVGAYSIRMKPGFAILPGMPFPAGISMEAWLPVESGERAFVYDFSFGYPTGDYYDMSRTHTAAENIIQKMYEKLDREIGLPGNAEWRGSKAAYLRKSGLNFPEYTGIKKLEMRSYKPPKKSKDGTISFNDDPS
ncbi:MAG: hypothetical protein MI863_25210 [Desulfobacterales bacterium]|nr:hypothetical protein [Desulfobacterales bacterium]